MLSELSLPPTFTKMCVTLSTKKIYNTQLSKFIPFPLISLLSGQRQSAGVFAHLSYVSAPRIENKDKAVNFKPSPIKNIICLFWLHLDLSVSLAHGT